MKNKLENSTTVENFIDALFVRRSIDGTFYLGGSFTKGENGKFIVDIGVDVNEQVHQLWDQYVEFQLED